MNSIVYHTSKEFSKTTQHSYTPIVIWVILFSFSFINRTNIANQTNEGIKIQFRNQDYLQFGGPVLHNVYTLYNLPFLPNHGYYFKVLSIVLLVLLLFRMMTPCAVIHFGALGS